MRIPFVFGLLFTMLLFFGCGESAKVEKSDGDQSAGQTTADKQSQNDSSQNGSAKPRSSTIPKSTGDMHFSMKFLSWNVESEGADPATIAKQLGDLGRYDLIALTEVLPSAATDFCSAFGDDYLFVLSETGRTDSMMLIYNKNTLDFVRKFELHDINFKNRYRSPLVGHFRDALTGKELLVMVNHLARGSEKTRQIQAEKLVEWARDQTMPIVALGDYNFDYEFDTRQGNEAFRLFMKDNVWKWIEPYELIDTNWYDNPQQPDGKDDYPGSMLDFAFVAGSAKEWTTSCKVIVRDGDFPDDAKTSDHRPFELIVSAK
jgi:endonuclease/exonuclease/phosphatase family metal-dependent hydrolase